MNTDKLPFLIKEGVLTDEQLEKGMTEAEAVKKGLIRRDTMWVLAKDTLLGKNYDVAAMRYVPAVPGEKITFKMDTATLNLVLVMRSKYSLVRFLTKNICVTWMLS